MWRDRSGAVLVLLGVKWFDHVLLVLGAASISEMFRALARPVGKTFASCIEAARLDLPIGCNSWTCQFIHHSECSCYVVKPKLPCTHHRVLYWLRGLFGAVIPKLADG